MNKTGSIKTKRNEITTPCLFRFFYKLKVDAQSRTFVCQVTFFSRKNTEICGRQSLSFPMSAIALRSVTR